MRRLCFYQRMALWLVAVFIVVLGVFFYCTAHFQNLTRSEAEQQLHLGLAEYLASDNPLLQQGVYDYEALKNLFHTLMVLGPNFEFYYLNPQGKILTYSAEKGKTISESVSLAPVISLIEKRENLPVFGDDPRKPGVQKIFSAAPVYNQGELQGYLYVILGGEKHDSVLSGIQASQSMRMFATFIAASLVFLLIVLLVLFRFLTLPLKRLAEDMEKFRAADFHVERAALKLADWLQGSNDEVQRLGCAFNDMLRHIEQQFSQLQQIDSQRRILLADLSHDLRTPLASLQGYIETLALNSDSLSADDRKRFIEISLKNANNLKRLIDQIFELAYIEGGQVTLHRESFPLGDLLHDVVAKFSLKAQEKNLQLGVSPSQFDYQVFADIGKLERVLTNLIDNAIRHTPSGGKIELGVSAGAEKIRIDIRDSGIGISDKEIAFIFDARYQATNTEKDSCLHAGLGLAISKKLMALLDADLRVHSELGKGTCFSFELQQAKVA